MSSVDSLIEPLRHSPQLPQAIAILQAELEAERQRRDRFYHELSPDQKIEFIDGEVILHPPARNRHLDVTHKADGEPAKQSFVVAANCGSAETSSTEAARRWWQCFRVGKPDGPCHRESHQHNLVEETSFEFDRFIRSRQSFQPFLGR